MKKHIEVDGIDRQVFLLRRKGTRNLKIALKGDGTVQLSVPYAVPEAVAVRYLKSKAEWVNANSTQPHVILDGAHIGKAHRLVVEHADISRSSTKITATSIRVRLPIEHDEQSGEAQEIIKKACDKALHQQAEKLIPQRLAHIAAQHKLTYSSVAVKKLKSRWGACDAKNNLSFNSYLIQYDWRLIDYVICHELAHTLQHNHSQLFWKVVEKMIPDYKDRKKELKDMPTDVITT